MITFAGVSARSALVVVLIGATAALVAAGAAQSANGVYELESIGNRSVALDGGGIVQYVDRRRVTGTGVFDPFLQTRGRGRQPTQVGYNTDGVVEFDTVGQNAGHTRALRLSDVPVVMVDGRPHWELFADTNEPNGGTRPRLSLNGLEVWLTDEATLSGYAFGSSAEKVYDFDGAILFSDVNPGSGRGDLRYLVPADDPPPGCGYRSEQCETYVVLYTEWGFTRGFEAGAFIEWGVNRYDAVSVDKSARLDFERRWLWQLRKSARDQTGNDITDSIRDAAADGGFDYHWRVEVRADPDDTGSGLSGEVTVANDTARTIGVSVSDAIPGAIVDCDPDPEVVDPTADVPAQGRVTCAYRVESVDPDLGSNTAYVDVADPALISGALRVSATAAFDTGSPLGERDATATLSDRTLLGDQHLTLAAGDHRSAWTEIAELRTPLRIESAPCGSSTYSNRARIESADSGPPRELASARASFQIDRACPLTLAVSAQGSYERDWEWSLAKQALDPDRNALASVALRENQSYRPWYRVDVAATPVDLNAVITGSITLTNHNPDEDIVATVSGDVGAIEIDCDPDAAIESATGSVPAGGRLTCTYRLPRPDATPGAFEVRVSYQLDGVTRSGDTTTEFTFGAPTREHDRCATIRDDAGTPGAPRDDLTWLPCVERLDADGRTSFEYGHVEVGLRSCGDHEATNTTSLSTPDDPLTTIRHTLGVSVDCASSCTLSQSYWKTHNASFWGSAVVDPTWEALLGGQAELTPFFISGHSHFVALWTGTSQSAYYPLAREFIAASLNRAAGATSPSEVDAALSAAETLFETTTPTEATSHTAEQRAPWLAATETLGDYNAGAIGPGACDEGVTIIPDD